MFGGCDRRKVWVFTLIVVSVAGLLGGCGDESTPPTKPPQNFIYRADGGTVTLNGQVTLTVPPEAISQDAEVQIGVVDTPPALPDGYGFASPAFGIALSAGQVTDTVLLEVAYLDGLLPEGVLEAALLIGRVEGQNWVFEDPLVLSVENKVHIGAMKLGTWAVIWRAMEPKATISAMLAGLLKDVSQRRRADLELALGTPDVAEIITDLQDYQSRLEAASGSDPLVAAAISDFFEANRVIENDGNRIGTRTAEELASSFLKLGTAVGHDQGGAQFDPPRVRLGTRQFLPTAFARLFADAPGYGLTWESAKTGRLQPRDSVIQDFFVQLNYHPTFGGLTYLDPPAGISRAARVLQFGSTGIYRLDLVQADLPGGRTVYYDYIRNRELALHWPVDDDILLFNFLGQDNTIGAVGYRVEFADLLVDFGTARTNPFSSAAQADTMGSWLYFGLPLADMVGLRKQDGHLVLLCGSGSQAQPYELQFPVNLRPIVIYGDWTAPAAITDLAVVEYRGNSVRLRWTAPGNDLNSGTATAYDLRHYTTPITESNWDQAELLPDELLPAPGGTVQETLLLPFDLSVTRHLAIKTRDDDFNISGLSNVLQLDNLDQLEVHLPDRALERALRTAILKPEGTLYARDFTGITELRAPARAAIVLEGMQYVPNLTTLDLYSNLQIVDLSPLEFMLGMRWMRLSANDVGDITPLWRMKNLRFLDASSNRIEYISSLAGLTNLDSLNLRYNRVSNLAPLTRLTGLKYLDLGTNGISDLGPLRNLRNLVTLNLDRNQIEDLMPLIENTSLGVGDTVNVRENPLARLTLFDQVPVLLARGVVLLYDDPWD